MSITQTKQSSAVSVSHATLGPVHGYHFDGDSVELTASFRIHAPSAHQRAWALRLLACNQAPAQIGDVSGLTIATVTTAALPPLSEIADEVETFTVRAAARPPAGRGDHVMVLALVAAGADGRFSEVHDFAAYPRREAFVLPRFAGEAGATLADGRAQVRAAAIENPRAPANLTGTLSLELWALPETYTGGDFAGVSVAGAVLGRLAGQNRWTGLQFDLPAVQAPRNSVLVLMLREWNGAGYATRDFVNLPSVPAAVAAETLMPTVTVRPAPAAPTKAMPAVTLRPASAAPAVTTKTAPAASAAPRQPATRAGVDINGASLEELIAVKGLTRPMARAIIAARPFRRLDDLLEVKGLGPKVLAKVRDSLRVG